MTETKKNVCTQAEDVQEMLNLIGQLTSEEKREIKGIMIGIQMSRDFGGLKTA